MNIHSIMNQESQDKRRVILSIAIALVAGVVMVISPLKWWAAIGAVAGGAIGWIISPGNSDE